MRLQGQVRGEGEGQYLHLKRKEEGIVPGPRRDGCVEMMPFRDA